MPLKLCQQQCWLMPATVTKLNWVAANGTGWLVMIYHGLYDRSRPMDLDALSHLQCFQLPGSFAPAARQALLHFLAHHIQRDGVLGAGQRVAAGALKGLRGTINQEEAHITRV